VQVTVQGLDISVKGPRGQLQRRFNDLVEIKQEGEGLVVTPRGNDKRGRAMQGLSRSLLNNMVEGVSNGFKKSLEVHGVGYKVAAEGAGLKLDLGFSHSINFELPAGLSATVQGSRVTIEGVDKELLGQTAANIRALRPPEPYKGKGIRYVDENVRRKEGKKAVG